MVLRSTSLLVCRAPRAESVRSSAVFVIYGSGVPPEQEWGSYRSLTRLRENTRGKEKKVQFCIMEKTDFFVVERYGTAVSPRQNEFKNKAQAAEA